MLCEAFDMKNAEIKRGRTKRKKYSALSFLIVRVRRSPEADGKDGISCDRRS